jgi:RNA polymerase sigma-70 factor (ECF subfamily)
MGALAGLLTSDVVMTLPPLPLRYSGRAAVTAFLARTPEGGDRAQFRFLPTRANRQPALALYRRAADGQTYCAWGMFVLGIDGEAIAEITTFGDASLIPAFGLPDELAGEPR